MCAAGLEGSTADDVAKEVAIYRAHKASPIVIATDGQARFAAALHVISVPGDAPAARLRADRHGRAPVRLRGRARHRRPGPPAARGAGRHRGRGRRARRQPTATGCSRSLQPGLAAVGDAASSTACAAAPTTATSRPAPRCGWRRRYRYALGIAPLDAYQAELGRIGTPAVVVDDLTAALTQGIEELTRPVDAIKHQAKTVTVGISRSDETLLQPPLVQAVLAAGRRRDRLSYKTLRTLADLDPAVAEVTGWIRYELDGDPEERRGAGVVVDRGGIALDIPSRTERVRASSGARSTPSRVERQVFVTRGREDGRTVVIVPETKDDRATGLTLLHVRFHDRLAGGRGPRRAAGLPQPLVRAARRGARDRAHLPRGPAPEVPAADLLVEPHPRARRPLAQPGMIGIGVDLCEVDRMRTALERTPDPPARGCSPTTSRPTATAARTRPSATPPASPPRRRC